VKARAAFLGPRHDIDRLFKAADAFLLPSRSEGMSNALLEAMACGLPVLATRVSGTEGLVKDGEDGLLYAPGDFAGLRQALDRLILEPGLREKLGKAAREKVKEYSLERTVDKWLELYNA
jgi:glycosyltransferase involved in cell wall biosynthesis